MGDGAVPRRGRHGPGGKPSALRSRVRSALDNEQGDELVIASLDAPSGDLGDVERLSIDSMSKGAKASKAKQRAHSTPRRGPDFCGQRLASCLDCCCCRAIPLICWRQNSSKQRRRWTFVRSAGSGKRQCPRRPHGQWLDMDTETVLQTPLIASGGFELRRHHRTPPPSRQRRRLRDLEKDGSASRWCASCHHDADGTERTVMTSGGGGQWSLDDATRLSTAIGIATILTSGVGLLGQSWHCKKYAERNTWPASVCSAVG